MLPDVAHGLVLRADREKVYKAVADFLDRNLKAAAANEVVDQGAGDREARRQAGQAVDPEPAGVLDLRLLRADLSRVPVGHEADHQRVRERPGLAAEVADVPHLDPHLLAHLAGDRLLQRLARLDETGERAVDAGGEVGGAGEQELLPALDAHDHGRRDAGELLQAAARADAARAPPAAAPSRRRTGRRSGGCGPTRRSAPRGRRASRPLRRAPPRGGAAPGTPGLPATRRRRRRFPSTIPTAQASAPSRVPTACGSPAGQAERRPFGGGRHAGGRALLDHQQLVAAEDEPGALRIRLTGWDAAPPAGRLPGSRRRSR